MSPVFIAFWFEFFLAFFLIVICFGLSPFVLHQKSVVFTSSFRWNDSIPRLISFLWSGVARQLLTFLCFAKEKVSKRKATVDSPLRGAYATLQHNLRITKNGKVLKLAFGSDNNTFLSIFCDAQITSSQTGVGQKQHQKPHPTMPKK